MSQRWGLTERDSDKLRYLAVPPPAAAHCKGGTKQEGLPGKWDRCQKIHSKGISCSAWRIQGSFDVSSAGHKALTPRLFSEIKVGVFFRRQICRDPVTAPASRVPALTGQGLHLWVLAFLTLVTEPRGTKCWSGIIPCRFSMLLWKVGLRLQVSAHACF